MTNKFFDLLPIQHQTSVNRNFFESTIEQLFSKSNIENIQGFIGTPRNITSNTVFIEQPAPNREYYSFDPVVTTVDAVSGKPNNYTFYEDFLYDLRSKGALTDNHDRLFKTNQYSYAPPVDLDKLINYQDYYWYPTGPEVTEVKGNASVSINIDSIIGLKTFTSPTGTTLRNDMVVKFTGDYITGTSYSVDTAYVITGVGNAIQLILPADSTSAYAEYNDFQFEQSNSSTYTNQILNEYYSDSNLPGDYVDTTGGNFKESWRNIADSTAPWDNSTMWLGNLQLKVGDAVTNNVKYLGNNTQRTGNVVYADVSSITYYLPDGVVWSTNFAIDDFHSTYINPQIGFNIDEENGWGTSPWGSETTQDNPDYMVVHKGAKNKNPWSRLNYWWHVNELREPLKDNTTGFALPTSAVRATRPILEFDRDIELYNWGNTFISTVDIISDKKKTDLEGLAIGFPINSASGTAGSTIIFPQDDQTIAQNVYKINDNSGTISFTIDSALTANVVTGGHVYSVTGTSIGLDYYWTGTKWQQAQQKIAVNQEPQFNLYDSEGVKVDDPAKYPFSNFKGCPVFTYNTDKTSSKTTTYDSNLNANIVYQTSKFSSEPTFYNHLGNHTVTYKANLLADTSTISGYLFFKDLQQDYKGNDNTRYRTNWHPVSLPTKYREFSSTQTYFANEVVKQDNQYFVASANISAGNFNIANFNYYEDKHSVTSKQYVEDVIIIDKINDTETFFTTSATPDQEDLIVKLNDKALTINKDFGIRSSTTGITLNPILKTVTLRSVGSAYETGDVLTLGIAGSNSNVQITVSDAEAYDGNISNGGGQIKSISVANYGMYNELVGHPGNISSTVVTSTGNGHGVGATFDFTFTENVSLKDTDVLNIRTFTKGARKNSIGAYGFFEIPSALKHNPLNSEVVETRLSDLIGHGNNILESQTGFTGSVTGNNNYKDTEKSLTTNEINIGQVDSDLVHALYLSKNENRNILNALRFGNDEYNKFKRKFLTNLEIYLQNNDYLDQTNLDILDTVLKVLKATKLSKDSFDLTYMLPIGSDYSSEDITVSNVSLQEYTFSNTVNVALDKNLHILQHNNTILCADKDYTIDTSLPFDVTLANNITLAVGDTLTLRVYEDSESSGMPASLPKLGMYRAFQPQYVTDTSYQTNKDVILCHDGSHVIRQNDKIDEIILAFEQIIYSNIDESYRTCEYIDLNEYNIKPSYFAETDFTLLEFNQLLQSNFNKWSKSSNVDYTTNTVYDSTNEFTWNYANGPSNPGYWRGMFDYYYDTQTPNTTPWEMFGFCKKPSWWDTTYTSAITSSYTAFWNNVRDGYIPSGSRKGYWKRWARPTINSLIPVDSSGNLRSPQDFIHTSITNTTSGVDALWSFGDIAPSEYAWRKSSYYPFAILEALYLSRPGEFAKQFYDKRSLKKLTVQPEQLVDKATNKRKLRQTFDPHGYITADNVITLRPGYTTLLDQYLKFYSLSTKTEIGDPIKTLDTRLGHKFGGFVNSKTLKVFSESISVDGFSASQVLPIEDVTVNLHTSPYNSRNFYTGVKITKSTSGFTVSGYDTTSQYFEIIPSNTSGPKEGVQEGGTPADFSIFDTTVNYLKGEIIKFGGTYYMAKENTSNGVFATTDWTTLTALPTIGGASGTIYQSGTGITEKVFYDTVFNSSADVFDFLISLGRKQKELGFDFGEYDNSINSINDWGLAGRRFLFWSTEAHSVGESIKLSPLSESVKFTSTTGKIAKIQRQINDQYSIVDENGNSIIPDRCSIVRKDNEVIIEPIDNRIYAILLHTELVEHAFVINNKTVFNDIINDNILGVRQDRLEVKTQRSKNWDGRYQAEGLVIVGDAVLPNFETLIDSIRLYHDKDAQLLDPLKSQLAKGLIGYETTDDYADIKVDDKVGFEYHKGVMNSKGTANSLTSLIRSNVVNTNKNIELYEEWAIKRGEFGDVYNHQSMDIKLEESKFIRDNQQVEIIYPENVTGAVSNIFVFERNTTYYSVPNIEIDAPANGNAATATAKLYANAQLESVTITNGGDGYASKPNVAVITGNIVISEFSDVLAYGLAGSSATVDMPLTGANALTNVSITDHTTSTTRDIYLGNERNIDNVVTAINKDLVSANVANVTAFSDIDTPAEIHSATQITKGTTARVTTASTIEINSNVTSLEANVLSVTLTNPLTVTLTGTAQEKYFGPGDSITLVNKSQAGYPIAEANLLNKTYFTKPTAVADKYELYSNKALTANVDASAGWSTPGSNLQDLGAYHSANADLANIQFNLASTGATHNSALFAEWTALNGTYFVHKQTSTTFDLYSDPAMQLPLNTSTLTSQYQTSSSSYANIQANITLLGTGGDNRLFIRGYDFTLAESTLPGGNPSATLPTLNMTAGRYQPIQRFPIRSANNTTTNDIIVNVDNVAVANTYWAYDRGSRTSITANASIVNDYSINPNNAFSIVLSGNSKFEDQNIVNIDGKYPYTQIFVDDTRVYNTPEYTAFTLANDSTTTTISFSNTSLFADNFSIGSNITVIESGSVQFNNTFTADVPGKVLNIKSVANDTLIANTISKRTYNKTADVLTDNKITIDIDDTETMLKRPSNSLQDGLWHRSYDEEYIVPNAGYVNKDKIQWESIDLPYFANMIGNGKRNIPGENDYLHLGKSENEDWNVYRLKKHGIENATGIISGAKNYIDNTEGRAYLFSDQRLSKWTDGNLMGDKTNANYFDNAIVLKNANLSSTVVEWSNETSVLTPRVVYKGDYIPLKKISRNIQKIRPAITKDIEKVEAYKDPNYMARIYGDIVHPTPNLDFFTKAGIIKDNLPGAHAHSVIVSVITLSGLDVGDTVRFYGAQATLANITVAKAYTVQSISERGLGGNPGAVDSANSLEGFFTIQEANVTSTDFASIDSASYVSYEGPLNFNLYTRVKGLSGTNTVKLEMGDGWNTTSATTYISNGLKVNFTNNGGTARLTTVNDYFDSAKDYTVANWNSTDKTFDITANVNVNTTATFTRTGYNEITLQGFGNSDGQKNSTLSGANSAIVEKGDFVQFTSSGAYSGNVYPVQSNDGAFVTIYDPATTSNTSNRTAIVYTGSKTTRTGTISSLTSNTLTITGFTTSNLGNYGFGNIQYLNSNTSTGVIPSLSGTEKSFKINSNTIIVDVTDSVRTMQARFPTHVLRDEQNKTVDLFFKDDGAGEFGRTLFNTSEKTPESQSILSNNPEKFFQYDNKPVYMGLGLETGLTSLSLETNFAGVADSLRSIDSVELDLEFRYADASAIAQLFTMAGQRGDKAKPTTYERDFGVEGRKPVVPMPDPWDDSEIYDAIDNSYDALSKLGADESKWWMDTFTTKMVTPSMDGMFINLSAKSTTDLYYKVPIEPPGLARPMSVTGASGRGKSATQQSSKLELIPRYIGQHSAFNTQGETEKGLTIAGVKTSLLDENKNRIKLKFKDSYTVEGMLNATAGGITANNQSLRDHMGNEYPVHAGQPKKIRARLQTNEIRPSHINGGRNPFEWWGEDVKNVFGRATKSRGSQTNKLVLELGFENGTTTYPLNNEFDQAFPIVIIHGAKINYTLAPTTKTELTNLRVAIKDDSGSISGIVDRKIKSVNNSSITIDNSDNKFQSNDTTNNLNAVVYQIDENKNKQLLVNDYGSPVEQSTSETGHSAILLQPRSGSSSLIAGTTFAYISKLYTELSPAGTFYMGINNSANVSLQAMMGSNLDIVFDYLPLNHTGINTKIISAPNVAIDVHTLEPQHKMFMDTEGLDTNILRFDDNQNNAASVLTGNIAVSNVQTNYAIIPKGTADNIGNAPINQTEKNNLDIIVATANGSDILVNDTNHQLTVSDMVFFNTGSSANGINNTEFSVKTTTPNTFTMTLANTNIMPKAELTSIKYLTYPFKTISGEATATTVTARTVHVPANVHIFESGDTIRLTAGAVDTASVNNTTFVVGRTFENGFEINHPTAPTNLTTNLTAALDGNASLHIVTVPPNYATNGLTTRIYDPANEYALGGNVDVTLKTITDLELGDDKYIANKFASPIMYFEKNMGTTLSGNLLMMDVYEATRFYSKDHSIGKFEDHQLVLSSTNSSADNKVNIELPNGLTGLAVGGTVTFSSSKNGHALHGNTFTVIDFVNITDPVVGGGEQYITIEAAGAVASANVFSVSYDNYIPDQTKAIKITGTEYYDGFATPFFADKNSFVIKTNFLGNVVSKGNWISDTMIITGSNDLNNEINAKPNKNHIAIKNSPIRNLNAVYKMAPIGYNNTNLATGEIEVFGFANSNANVVFTDQDVSYEIVDSNVIEVNDNRTYLPNSATLAEVKDSLNFASDFKMGSTDKEKKLELGFLFGRRDPRSDNREQTDFNQKFVQRPADVSGLEQVYSYQYSGIAPNGNALQGGVNKFLPIESNETISQRRAPSKQAGKFIIDIAGLEEQIYYGSLNDIRTSRPHTSTTARVLDGKITSDKPLVKEYEDNQFNTYLDPTLQTIKNRSEQPFASPFFGSGHWWGQELYNVNHDGHGTGGGYGGGGGVAIPPGGGTLPPVVIIPPPPQETCGKFRITMYDSNSGEEGITYEFAEGHMDIVQQHIDSGYETIDAYQQQFLSSGGTSQDWSTIMSYLEGKGTNYTKIPYKQIDVDLCELEELHIKDIAGNTCTSSGEVMYLGGDQVSLPEGCDPCALADSINSQSPNFNAECVPAEEVKEPKSCVIKGGGQGWGTTDFRNVDRILQMGNNVGQSIARIGQRDDNYKILTGRKSGAPAVLFGKCHDSARMTVKIEGTPLLESVKLNMADKGLDPKDYNSIIIRSTTNDDNDGELLHWRSSTNRIEHSGAGVKGEYNNIRRHPFAIVWAPSSGSVFEQGAGDVQFSKEDLNRGINKDTVSVYVSKNRRSYYNYATTGEGPLYRLPKGGTTQELYLGDLYNMTVIDDLWLGAFGSKADDDEDFNNAITVSEEKDDRGWKYTKISGYGKRITDDGVSGGRWADRTGGWFKNLWQYHPTQQRRVQGCTTSDDVNMPQLNPIVRIKSAVPFTLGKGCARSPFTEVGDFQPYREKVINSSANLTISNAMTPDEYNDLGGDTTQVFSPKVLSGGLPGQQVNIYDIVGAPDTGNPFMTSDYIMIGGYPTNPRAGEGTRDGAIANSSLQGPVQTGMVEDSTGFNYMIGDKLTLVGGQPKTIDEDAYYLDSVTVINPGAGYSKNSTRLQVVDKETGTPLPGIQLKPNFQPDTNKVTPVANRTGRTALSSAIIPYKTYIGVGGCTDKNWLNSVDTNTSFIDMTSNSINGITLDSLREDIGLNSVAVNKEEVFNITATTEITGGTQYKAFIGTRDYENAGSTMMFNFDMLDNTGNHNRGASNFTTSFSEAEQVLLQDAWIVVWEAPNTVINNNHNMVTNFSALAEGTTGILKAVFDESAYSPDNGTVKNDTFEHFLSENIKTLNGRVIKFLKIANGKVYFQIINAFDLDSGASPSIGAPDFANIWCRFYPINSLSTYASNVSATHGAVTVSLGQESAVYDNATAVGTAGFQMTDTNGVAGLKVIAQTSTFNLKPLDQQWDIFIYQDGVDRGYLRLPVTVHPSILDSVSLPDGTYGVHHSGTDLANKMRSINYSTVYRPLVQPVNNLKDSEAIVYKFDFSNLPDDAKVRDIDIDLKFESYAPGDFDMMWLTAPDGKRIPLLQTLGRFGATGEYDQGGFLDGYDYNSSRVSPEFAFTLTSKQEAEAIKYGGSNLTNNNKVKPWIGLATRHPQHIGIDFAKRSTENSPAVMQNVIGSDYDSSNGTNLDTLYGITWNKVENILTKFLLDTNNAPRHKAKGIWFIEFSRSGRIRGNNRSTMSSEEENRYTKTRIRTPNIKIDYISASENPEWDTAHKESIGSISVIQKGGFQPEFASRTYEVRAIGTGSGFSGQAFLKKGVLVGDDNPDMKSQQAHFEVIKINQSGSITELRILDRGVYEIFPAEFERGVALKYSDSEMVSKAMIKRPMGVGYGGRVQLTARSVINCQQPPRIVEDNAGASRPADATELLADAINAAGGLDGGITATSLPVNSSVSNLKLKTDADGLEFSDLVPGTLDAIGIQAGDYGPGSFGFGADLGDGGTGFGLGDSGIRKDNPFDKGDPDSLILYNASVPPEFDGLTSQNFGDVYSYDINRIGGGPLVTDKLQTEIDVLYLQTARVNSKFELKPLMKKAWVDNYDVNGWAYLENGKIVYQKDKLVDSSKLKSAIVYDNETGKRITDVYLNDPFKNVFMPEVESNLTYISESDPVYYADDSSNFSIKNVGELWWNTSTMRVRWYEQADEDYRRKYWASYMNGSQFDVYQWIESTQTPLEYTGQGTPLDIEKYLIDQVYNTNTGTYDNKYYYWVKDLPSVPNTGNRSASAFNISQQISSPKMQNIPTYGAISNNSIVLNNVKSYLKDDDSVFQLNFKRSESRYGNKHESYILIGQDNISDAIPQTLFNKLIDSLCEEDILGKTVPDQYLNKFEKYGISIRPRQTMFVKPATARREMAYFINKELLSIKLTEDRYAGWNSSIATSTYYEITDWVATGYNTNEIKARANVNSIKQMRGLTTIPDGAYVRLVGTGTNPDKFYVYDATLDDYILVKIVNGTAKLKDTIFDTINSGLSTELRQILTAIKDTVFKNTNLVNKLYFSMLNYVLSEQYQTDWAFKTTYFNIRQSAENLVQSASTKIDAFNNVVRSIKNNKPYTSKLRDFEDRKISIDSLKSFATDFDRPPYQPDLSVESRILDDASSSDVTIITQNDDYVNWTNNFSNNATKIRTIKETIHFDRTASEIKPIFNHTNSGGVATVQMATDYKQPQSNTSAIRMQQLSNVLSNATPINHIERVFKYNTVVTGLTEKIADTTTYSSDVIAGFIATRDATIRTLAYADFVGEELDANLFAKAYYDTIGKEISSSSLGYDLFGYDSAGFDSKQVVNNYTVNAAVQSQLIRDTLTYQGFDSSTFFTGLTGPGIPPESAVFKPLEGLQMNVQTQKDGRANVSFKIFVGMNGATEYIRLNDTNKTTLAVDMSKTDLTITLTDASVITPPYTGSTATAVFIGDERITFEEINGNTLTGVTRGTNGTSVETHTAGEKVYDATETNNINASAFAFGTKGDPEFVYWNLNNDATTSSIAESTNTIAEFLQAGPGSYFG